MKARTACTRSGSCCSLMFGLVGTGASSTFEYLDAGRTNDIVSPAASPPPATSTGAVMGMASGAMRTGAVIGILSDGEF